jgi:hypothetical protein
MFEKRIIIGGLPRSGSTLLRVLLNMSNHVIAGPETAFFTQPLWVLQNRVDRISTRISEKLEIRKETISDAILQSNNIFLSFDEIMGDYAIKKSKDKAIAWAEKTPTNCDHYHRLKNETVGDVYFISIIRHGLDVVTSKIENHPKRKGYWCSIQRYIESMHSVNNFTHDNHYTLKYEDLVNDPLKEIQNIFFFIGLPCDYDLVTKFESADLTKELTKVNQPKLSSHIQTSWISRYKKPEHNARVSEFLANIEAVRLLELSGYVEN